MSATIVRAGAGESVEIDVQVVPRASRSRVVGVHGDRLKIQLAAPPVDGAANEALIELVADLLACPRGDVTITRGQTGKRKTLRVLGLGLDAVRQALGLGGGGPATAPTRGRARRPLALEAPRCLALALALAPMLACESAGALPLHVVLPEGDDDLDRADNAALVLDPGPTKSFAIDGVDFSLAVELEVDAVQRVATLYLARGDELLAYGRSAPFALAETDAELALFVGRPGALSTFPGAVSGGDTIVAARALGRGLLLVSDGGGTFLFSERTLQTEAGEDFPADPPPADASALVPDQGAGVTRLSWADPLLGWRFDPGVDAWSELEFTGEQGLGPRTGAAYLVDSSAAYLILFGGGEASDIVEIALVADDQGEHPVRRIDPPLDGPRRGASAAWVTRAGTDEGEGALLFGGDQDDLPIARFTGDPLAAGPTLRWTGAGCQQVEVGTSAGADAELRVLCLGGLLDGAPTRDAALVRVPPAGPPTVEVLAAWLPVELADPRLFGDEGAIYAQGAGHVLRIDRQDLTQSEIPNAADRATGGHSVNLGTGVTFLLGGVTAEGQPVDRWQVFTPALPAPD